MGNFRRLVGHFGPEGRRWLSQLAGNVAKEAEEYARHVNKVRVNINGHNLDVPEGTSILQAARQAGTACVHGSAPAEGIFIPTLCTDPRLQTTPGTCRVCLVEANGKLTPACYTPVMDNMHVETDTETVQKSIRSTLNLLKASHAYDCMNCEASGRCEFQDLIKRYNVSQGTPSLRLHSHEWDDEVQHEFDGVHDVSSASISIDLDKCIKCGRCVTACNLIQEMNVIGWKGRGAGRHPSVMEENLASSQCISCGQCSAVCPVAAIHERSEWKEVMDHLDSKRRVMVCMTAPSVRVAVGEEVGLAPGSVTTGQMVAAQRKLGFDFVFDVNFSADLTIMEEGTEFIQRIVNDWQGKQQEGRLPMFTSCCPAWINFVEKSHPELIPHLSSCKSPQQMLGALVKQYFAKKIGKNPEDIVLVSFMPCTAKKFEAERREFHTQNDPNIPDVDFVLTTREFGQMLRLRGIPLANIEESNFDSLFGQGTGAAILFGASGGVMESALRTAYEILTQKSLPKLEMEPIRGIKGVKTASIVFPKGSPAELAGREIRVAVASGIGNARHLLENLYDENGVRRYDFIEVMSCIGGCIGGGGQPKSKDPQAILKRMGSIYSLDQKAPLRKSHENPEVIDIYKTYLGDCGGHKAHKLLHTHYHDRSSP